MQKYQEMFLRLDGFLHRHRMLWQQVPFYGELTWPSQHAELYQAILALDEHSLSLFEQDDTANAEILLIKWLADFIDGLAEIATDIDALHDKKGGKTAGPSYQMAKFTDVGLPGRKKQQVLGFIHQLQADSIVDGKIGKVVDWCSGKGYLASHLSYALDAQVHCLEYDKSLCDKGQEQQKKQASKVCFHHHDVFQPLPEAIKLATQGADLHSALHACGDLHIEAIKQASQLGADMAIAPCCYHLIRDQHYQALSLLGKDSRLHLSKSDLRLAVLQSATAGQRVKDLRLKETTWRIGFDLLLRQQTGANTYQHQASFAKKQLAGSFLDFCQFMWQQTNQTAAIDWQTIDFTDLQNQAQLKHQQVIRLEKVRLGFRPLLEAWLILDRACFLIEQDYQVKLPKFCDWDVSPRNTLILAHKLNNK
ncbi:methyltransferase [Catenovulum sp. SM1970]|uniref:methyltransferase n=1 Tax=Marinifaba aquimaris TaxID=2741323 RepID=UPI001573E6FF|nr:methyltransferase [Marinifaba aquimaris]NTS77859.1 methyltransferase [Marinifaba aquimaris]